MANEIYDNTWFGNTIDTASSIGTSTEMIQGQFNMNKLGDDLVVNGNFATDSNWSKGTGWSIENGEAVALNSSNSNLEQIGLTVTNAKKYKIIFTINNYTSGAVKPMLGTVGATTGTNVSANGTYTEVLTANNNYDRIAFRTSGTAFNGSIDNVSVQQVRATTVEASKCLADTIHRIGLQDIQN